MAEISVIIPTYNRALMLNDLLNKLKDQTLHSSRFEVIVVDNASTDNTKDVVASFAQEYPNLRYVFEPEPGLHCGRHRGLSESKADILVFADDDILPDATWLEGHLESFADEDTVMSGGNNHPEFEGDAPTWLQIAWERPFLGGRGIGALSILELPGEARNVDPHIVWGCNFAIRKSTLLDAGGFHPDGMPDDLQRLRGDGETCISDFVARSNFQCRFNPNASVRHRVTAERMTIGYFQKRSFRQGISDSYTLLRKRSGQESLLQRMQDQLVACLYWAKILTLTLRERNRGLRSLKIACARSYRAGIAFHRSEYRKDQNLRAWIVQPDYL